MNEQIGRREIFLYGFVKELMIETEGKEQDLFALVVSLDKALYAVLHSAG